MIDLHDTFLEFDGEFYNPFTVTKIEYRSGYSLYHGYSSSRTKHPLWIRYRQRWIENNASALFKCLPNKTYIERYYVRPKVSIYINSEIDSTLSFSTPRLAREYCNKRRIAHRELLRKLTGNYIENVLMEG